MHSISLNLLDELPSYSGLDVGETSVFFLLKTVLILLAKCSRS